MSILVAIIALIGEIAALECVIVQNILEIAMQFYHERVCIKWSRAKYELRFSFIGSAAFLVLFRLLFSFVYLLFVCVFTRLLTLFVIVVACIFICFFIAWIWINLFADRVKKGHLKTNQINICKNVLESGEERTAWQKVKATATERPYQKWHTRYCLPLYHLFKL